MTQPAGDPPRRQAWRPSISDALIVGFGSLLLVALGAVLWIVLSTAQRNTYDLLRAKAKLTIGSIAARIEQHLGAASALANNLVQSVANGTLDPAQAETFFVALHGALAATPQMSGETADALSDDFVVKPLGAQRLRGRSGEITVFRLEGLASEDWTYGTRATAEA